MDRRERLIQFFGALLAAALAGIAARYGIPLPPIPPPVIEFPPDIARPAPLPPGPESEPPPDARKAIVRLSFSGVGCTATVIGPKRTDGRWWVLTAAHCCSRPGQHGTIRFLDGRTVGVIVQTIDKKSDCAWMYTESNSEVYPYALLADVSPAVGTAIEHRGYGVDEPGNTELGSVLSAPDSNGQLRFRLSVSSGDSGGGILVTKDGRLISCVCCTSSRGNVADVWGASPESIARARPTEMVLDGWKPMDIPVRMPPKD